MRQVINQDDAPKAKAEHALILCYMEGNGVEADTVQAVLWCQSAAKGGDARAIELLPTIRRCNYCGTTPARQLCVRCLKVRYCDHQCQLAHWNRDVDSHKGPCKDHRRRAAEASQQEAGGASTSAQWGTIHMLEQRLPASSATVACWCATAKLGRPGARRDTGTT
jgi:TPR repeat protein